VRPRILNFTFLIFFFGTVTTVWSQNKVHFADITIKAATQRANIENKNIFVDTYAPWCGPCKIMDIHFQDKEVIKYFNRNFINVKINTDTPYGKEVSTKYQIAFLPTILILTKDGDTRFKVDKLMSRDELLSLAKYAIDGPPSTPAPTPTPPVKVSPPKKAVVKVEEPVIKQEVIEPSSKKEVVQAEEIEDDSEEKILYVLDANATDLPPEILYQEAYFRVQLNDGSSKDAAKKYLATQDDWETEKNLKFIFDFLYDTDSEEFEYFVSNKEKFQEYISQEKINRSIKILVEHKLYQGIPRPTFDQSKYLLSLIDQEQGEKNNYHYFLNRLYTEGSTDRFAELFNEYEDGYENLHQDICIRYINTLLENKTSKTKLKGYLNLLERLEHKTENYKLQLLYSKLYFALTDKEKALIHANKAIEEGELSKLDISEAKQILSSIKEL